MNTHQQPSSKERLRDWWYSIQDLLAEKDICLHERKRVELEHILTSHSQAIRERVLALAPGFENTKTGEVTYDVGVQEYMARIEALLNDSDV